MSGRRRGEVVALGAATVAASLAGAWYAALLLPRVCALAFHCGPEIAIQSAGVGSLVLAVLLLAVLGLQRSGANGAARIAAFLLGVAGVALPLVVLSAGGFMIDSALIPIAVGAVGAAGGAGLLFGAAAPGIGHPPLGRRRLLRPAATATVPAVLLVGLVAAAGGTALLPPPRPFSPELQSELPIELQVEPLETAEPLVTVDDPEYWTGQGYDFGGMRSTEDMTLISDVQTRFAADDRFTWGRTAERPGEVGGVVVRRRAG